MMDPFSAAAGVVSILESVTRLSSAISRFKDDYKLADAELDMARQHALLLKEEIRAIESRKTSPLPSPQESAKQQSGLNSAAEAKSLEDPSFAKAMATASELLSTIEESFPLRSEPHTWRSKVRWAMKDKQVLTQVKERLKSAESTLQGIATMEQLRVSHTIYGMLQQQQTISDATQCTQILTNNMTNMRLVDQSPPLLPSYEEAQLSGGKPMSRQSTHVISKPTKQLPWMIRLDLWGFSAQLVALPKDKGKNYQAAVRASFLGKMYTIQIQLSCPDFSFDRMLHVRNVVPNDSAMSVACRTGDFDSARKLLTSGAAHGSDITVGGWPVLDYAIESGSSRLVRLLLEYGAHPDMAYGDHDMTALQSCFLRGHLDIARLLLNRGANIEYVDSDGYSVLSYLWVIDNHSEKNIDFMRLCLANDFTEVNACDSRGWSAFHRAAAIGTPEDVEAFLRLGASLTLRAEWYGWTALFFAASHDNVDTFQSIVQHSAADVYDSLDGDGWSLLHCCIYFGAPRVMRLLLRNGADVNQLSHPAPLPEDPELSYKELTPSDIAIYIGPNRYHMFLEALAETRREKDLTGSEDIFWDVTPEASPTDSEPGVKSRPIYRAEDDDDRWGLLHWASYNGSSKVKELLLLKGADPGLLDAMTLEENPGLLSTGPG